MIINYFRKLFKSVISFNGFDEFTENLIHDTLIIQEPHLIMT